MRSPSLEDPSPTLESIYRAHHGLVRWVLRARGVPEAALDDHVHDTFLAIFRRLPTRDPELPLRTWVAGVARNVSFSNRRASERRRVRAEGVAIPSAPLRPDEELERREAWSALSEFLDELRPELREVFMMVELAGVRVSELAETTGTPANTLHSRLKAARDRFGQRFDATDPAPLLRRARQGARPSPEQQRRTWGMIAVSIEGLPVVPSATATAWGVGSTKATLVTVLAGLLTAAGVVALEPGAPREPAIERSERKSHDGSDDGPRGRSTAATALEPAAAVGSAETEAIAEPPVEPARPRPTPPRRTRRDPAARPSATSPATAAPAPTPTEPTPTVEADPDAALTAAVTQLHRAREQLRQGHAAAALQALDELDSRVGQLERDRRRLELSAACRLGDATRVRQAAAALARLGIATDSDDPCRDER